MRVFKVIVLIVLPVLLFVNLWYFAFNGDNLHFIGFKNLTAYTSTYPGWAMTLDVFKNLGEAFENITKPVELITAVISIFKILFAPFTILISVISDLVTQVIWFFGWLYEFAG